MMSLFLSRAGVHHFAKYFKVCEGLNQLKADPKRLRSMTFSLIFRSVS